MTSFFIMLVLSFPGEGSATVLPAAARPGRDLASEVQALFAAKCTECHGAHLSRPRGQFGDVANLKRVANNPKVVVPFRPAESKLWNLLRAGKMPPEGAKAGPLTEAQKDVVRAWIEAGAPAASTGPRSRAMPPVAAADADGTADESGRALLERLLGWIGRFHVLVVHFPIALLTAAAVGEWWSWWRGSREPAPAVRFCVLLGAAGAVAGATLGWLHAAVSGYATDSSQALVLHRWIGTATGFLAVAVASLSEAEARCGVRSQFFRCLLFLAALLVSVAGHLGGTLVYGNGYFDW